MRLSSVFTHTTYEASLRIGYTAVSHVVLGNIARFPDGLSSTVSRGNWFVVGPIVSPIVVVVNSDN
jgi:hypothetical protein